jgi:hypothetical protein
MTDIETTRRNGKWASVSRLARGRYVVAQGWEGKLKAARIVRLTNMPNARLWAAAWLDD